MTPWKRNFRALLALTFLLGLTLGLSVLPLGVLHLPASFLVSLFKAALVVIIFMRLSHGDPLRSLALAAGVFWVAILFTLTLSDFLTRN